MKPFILVILGVSLILLQIYIEIHMRTDDKYVTKKSTETIIQELEEKRKSEGKLNLWDSHNLSTRVFIQNRMLGKIGVILIGIGIILEIMF